MQHYCWFVIFSRTQEIMDIIYASVIDAPNARSNCDGLVRLLTKWWGKGTDLNGPPYSPTLLSYERKLKFTLESGQRIAAFIGR